MLNFFCGLHGLVHFADCSNMCALQVQSGLLENAPIYDRSFQKSNESGALRLTRTVCKAVARGADEKNGKYNEFNLYTKDFLEANNIHSLPLTPFKGNRFTILFGSSAAVFFLHEHIKQFLEDNQSNNLLKSVLHDLNIPEYLASVKAFGLISRLITAPLWSLLEDKIVQIYDMKEHYVELVIYLYEAVEDIDIFMRGEMPDLFQAVHTDVIYNFLIQEWDDDDLVAGYLNIILPALAECAKMYTDHLPDGKLDKVSLLDKKLIQHISTTNLLNLFLSTSAPEDNDRDKTQREDTGWDAVEGTDEDGELSRLDTRIEDFLSGSMCDDNDESMQPADEDMSTDDCRCKTTSMSLFDSERIQDHILSVREMEKSEKELYVMGSLQKIAHERTKSGKRKRIRYRYVYDGRNVARRERKVYRETLKEAADEMSSHVRAIGPVAVLSCPELVHVHYTFDYSQDVTIPHHSRQMGPLNLNRWAGRNRNAWTEFSNKHAARLSSTAGGLVRVAVSINAYVRMYNASGQNKNRYVLAYLSWRIQMGLHEEILLLMQIPGRKRVCQHKKLFRRCDVDSLAQLAEVVDRSSKSNVPVLYKKTDGSENWALDWLVIPTARFFAGSRYSKIPLVPFLQGCLFRSLCKTDIRRTRSKGAAHETGRCLTSGNAKHSNASRSYCRKTALPKDLRTPVCATSVQSQANQRLSNYTSEIIHFGLWQSEHDVDRALGEIEHRKDKIKALKAQLNFRNNVLQQTPDDKKSVYRLSSSENGKPPRKLGVDELTVNADITNWQECEAQVYHRRTGNMVSRHSHISGIILVPNAVVPGYPTWYNIVYHGDEAVYTYKLIRDYEQGDLKLIFH
ncbi:hypothetical protein MAR_024167 [Mya arenaria]|uniref:Uncharacterized protein n=1 Tax=Mya arenaria TaxID=6604 RepID=A0ABY7DQ16_MYAAR|nr:hypothetical protein MAR_024167 [Mya arenaria]